MSFFLVPSSMSPFLATGEYRGRGGQKYAGLGRKKDLGPKKPLSWLCDLGQITALSGSMFSSAKGCHEDQVGSKEIPGKLYKIDYTTQPSSLVNKVSESSSQASILADLWPWAMLALCVNLLPHGPRL